MAEGATAKANILHNASLQPPKPVLVLNDASCEDTKKSGHGLEFGKHGLQQYCHPKSTYLHFDLP